MSIVAAFAWGGLSSASLYLGEALAGPLAGRKRTTGLIMGFGAGTLLSAVAYELIPESSLEKGPGIGVALLVGALAYYVGDRLVDRGGGGNRQDIDATGGGGAAMFIGALLDGIPEALILGITLLLGGGVSVAFVTAVFVSNVPQGIAGTASLQAAGYTNRRIFAMWTALTVAAAVTAAVGFAVGDQLSGGGAYAEAFAAGAVLTMLADSMMPEAFEHGGDVVGLLTVVGFLVAGILAAVG
jgi:zinc transporter, ZIP family